MSTLLDQVLTPGGWVDASAPPVNDSDPGRFPAMFGRDSLITALQLLPHRPDVAQATLRELAALQGRRDDPETGEEPGKILHEHWPRAPERLVAMGWPTRDGVLLYYGSADSTAWFLVVMAALGDDALATELEPAWRAAGDWLERALEHGGGLVRSGSPTGRALVQQGWRDTADPLDPVEKGGIVREDGGAPLLPLADADTQAVAVAALRALAALSREERIARRAEELGAEIRRRFGPDTMAIEADGREVRGAGSQLGWLLWSGATPAGAAARLTQPDVCTPWGLRTLSERHPQYDPHGYHRGSVWPFDSWLGWAGLRAAGQLEEAERVRVGVLRALDRLGGAPELYAVGPDGPEPVAIANRVQAWTVGARWALENEWDGRVGLVG